MNTISVNQESVAAYKELMVNPEANGMLFKPIDEIMEYTDTATPAHILYKEYLEAINNMPLPKIFFYIVMDELYPSTKAKALTGELGYKLKIKYEKPKAQS